ncbi:MAG: PQQ-binding-like beta-propeller repeat protein [Bacteroidota bacterium]
MGFLSGETVRSSIVIKEWSGLTGAGRAAIARAFPVVVFLVAGCSGLHLDRPLRPGENDWVTEGGSPLRVNATALSVVPPLEIVWEYNAQGGIRTNPLVRDSVVLVTTSHGELQAVNLTNGKRLGYRTVEAAVHGTPVLDGLNVFVATARGSETLHLISLRDGRTIWKLDLGPIESAPLLAGDNLYVTTLEGKVYCVSRAEGEIVWKFVRGEEERIKPFRSSPAANADLLVFGSDDGMLYAVDLHRGILRWQASTGGSVFAGPVIAGSRVYVGSLSGTFFAFDVATGAEAWRFDTGAPIYGAAAASHTAVYVGSSNGALYSFDPESGNLNWKFESRSVINSPPLVAGDLLYVGSMDRTLYVLDSSSGSEVWSFKAPGRIKVTPVLWGEYLLVTSEDKYITALKPNGSR